MTENEKDNFIKPDNDFSSDKTPQIIKQDEKNIFNFLNYIKNCFNKLIKIKWDTCQSKISLLTQFLIFSIPFSICLYICLYFLLYYLIEEILIYDYYKTIKHEYLSDLVINIDDVNLEIGVKGIKGKFEEFDSILFFKIYFNELISMGLLNEDTSVKIFPNISNTSEQIHLEFDKLLNETKFNSFFRIPSKDAERYIDNRDDNLSELGKLYYYMLPIITQEAITKNTFMNQTFLIAYEFDNYNKSIIGNEFYFAFPKYKSELEDTNNFIPTNSYLSPQINSNETIHGEKYNNSYYFSENWFSKQDYDFRKSADDLNNYKLSFGNLNYDYYGKLNKSIIVSLQDYYYTNGKSYIINIIHFIHNQLFKDDSFEYSIFLLFNDTLNTIEKEKYSDNEDYLFAKLNIVEVALSSKLYEYFHYGTYDKNGNFISHGISYDIFDLESLGEPLKYYESSEYLNIDLRYFSVLYLYALLFKNLEYNETKNEFKDLNEINFVDNYNITEKICQEYDFDSYVNYLNDKNIDCWSDQNMLYNSDDNIERLSDGSITLNQYISKPYCICLPLYCIKNNRKNMDPKAIKYVDKITLPNQCQNNYNAYLNSVIEDYKNHSPKYEPTLKINYGLNNIKLFSKNIKNILENEFYIFTTLKLTLFNNLTAMIATIVDNSNVKYLYSTFIININVIKAYIILIFLIGMFIAFLLSIIFLNINVKKISNVINGYKKIYDNYLSQLETKNLKNKQQIDSIFNKGPTNKPEKKIENHFSDLNIKETNLEKNNNYNNSLYSNENSILNDYYKIFLSYYNFSKLEILKILANLKHSQNILLKIKENELFKILKIISIYIHKFKLVVSMDYNFYVDSKLNKNYIKSVLKHQRENDQQIMLTQSLIFELLSTEDIEDCGIITNINFRYITNINLNSKNEKNAIKFSLFNINTPEDEDNDEKQQNMINNTNEDKPIIEEKNDKNLIRIICKDKNELLIEFENNFENDDYLKKDILISYFDSFLVNVYYKYIKKLTSNDEPSYQENN